MQEQCVSKPETHPSESLANERSLLANSNDRNVVPISKIRGRDCPPNQVRVGANDNFEKADTVTFLLSDILFKPGFGLDCYSLSFFEAQQVFRARPDRQNIPGTQTSFTKAIAQPDVIAQNLEDLNVILRAEVTLGK